MFLACVFGRFWVYRSGIWLKLALVEHGHSSLWDCFNYRHHRSLGVLRVIPGNFFLEYGVGDGSGHRSLSLYNKDEREPGGAVWCQKGIGGRWWVNSVGVWASAKGQRLVGPKRFRVLEKFSEN
jgi:hypothetical protein